jgi:hypothetical protein
MAGVETVLDRVEQLQLASPLLHPKSAVRPRASRYVLWACRPCCCPFLPEALAFLVSVQPATRRWSCWYSRYPSAQALATAAAVSTVFALVGHRARNSAGACLTHTRPHSPPLSDSVSFEPSEFVQLAAAGMTELLRRAADFACSDACPSRGLQWDVDCLTEDANVTLVLYVVLSVLLVVGVSCSLRQSPAAPEPHRSATAQTGGRAEKDPLSILSDRLMSSPLLRSKGRATPDLSGVRRRLAFGAHSALSEGPSAVSDTIHDVAVDALAKVAERLEALHARGAHDQVVSVSREACARWADAGSASQSVRHAIASILWRRARAMFWEISWKDKRLSRSALPVEEVRSLAQVGVFNAALPGIARLRPFSRSVVLNARAFLQGGPLKDFASRTDPTKRVPFRLDPPNEEASADLGVPPAFLHGRQSLLHDAAVLAAATLTNCPKRVLVMDNRPSWDPFIEPSTYAETLTTLIVQCAKTCEVHPDPMVSGAASLACEGIVSAAVALALDPKASCAHTWIGYLTNASLHLAMLSPPSLPRPVVPATAEVSERSSEGAPGLYTRLRSGANFLGRTAVNMLSAAPTALSSVDLGVARAGLASRASAVARAHCRRAIALSPRDYRALHLLGRTLLEASQAPVSWRIAAWMSRAPIPRPSLEHAQVMLLRAEHAWVSCDLLSSDLYYQCCLRRLGSTAACRGRPTSSLRPKHT